MKSTQRVSSHIRQGGVAVYCMYVNCWPADSANNITNEDIFIYSLGCLFIIIITISGVVIISVSNLGPVVQSITSSLRGQLVKFLTTL